MTDFANQVVLFQGDSITDAGRNREEPTHMGFGYAQFVAARYMADYPDEPVSFLNRGIGGDRVTDLVSRWDEDCIRLSPTTVSILVGINDMWRRDDSGSATSPAEFEDNYRTILSRAYRELDARLVLLEPFLLEISEEMRAWREDLDPKIHIVRRLSREYEATLVPLDGLFAQASARRHPSFWAQDGVHPTPAGHALIAQAWIDSVEL